MDVVMNDVRLLVKKELAAANKKFPMFASAHEGWAVIREELQEVKDDHYCWNSISKIVFGMKFGTTTKFRKRI